jgi:hypothetical protein
MTLINRFSARSGVAIVVGVDPAATCTGVDVREVAADRHGAGY